MSCLQLEGSAVRLKMPLLLIRLSVLISVCHMQAVCDLPFQTAYSLFSFQFLSLSKSLVVELLQVWDRTTPLPVVSLVVLPPPTSGGKMVQSSKVKQQICSLSLLLECLMLDSILVRSLWMV